MLVASLFLLWIVTWFIACGLFLADHIAILPRNVDENYRAELGASIFFGMFPGVSLFFAILMTGFGEHGMCWTREGAREIAKRAIEKKKKWQNY